MRVECGCHECPAHREMRRANEKASKARRYQDRKALGYCVTNGCLEESQYPHVHCERHHQADLEAARESKRRKRERAQQEGGNP